MLPKSADQVVQLGDLWMRFFGGGDWQISRGEGKLFISSLNV